MKLGDLEEMVRSRTAAKIDRAKFGAVFIVNDDLIHFPNDENRVAKESRRVIAVQSELYCTAPRPNTIVVVPCSTSFRRPVASPDMELPGDEPAFTKAAVALVSQVMPILKIHLREHVGDLRTDTSMDIQARLLELFGLAASLPISIAAGEKQVG